MLPTPSKVIVIVLPLKVLDAIVRVLLTIERDGIVDDKAYATVGDDV